MKKIFYLAAAMSIAMFVSCEEKGGEENTKEPEAQKVTVAEDALVLYLPFEDGSVAVGEGVTFDKKVGAGEFAANGFIGKCYTNPSETNTVEAYLKYNLAATNFVKDLGSFTFSAWVNKPETDKGAVVSINGGGTDWPRLIFHFDNVNTETGAQDFNARIDVTVGEENPALWPNLGDLAFSTTNKWMQVVRTYDAETSIMKIYVDGVQVGADIPFTFGADADGNALPLGEMKIATETMDALFIGAWSSWVGPAEGDAAGGDWQSTYFRGSIDELRFYKRALTDEEVAQLNREERLINLE